MLMISYAYCCSNSVNQHLWLCQRDINSRYTRQHVCVVASCLFPAAWPCSGVVMRPPTQTCCSRGGQRCGPGVRGRLDKDQGGHSQTCVEWVFNMELKILSYQEKNVHQQSLELNLAKQLSFSFSSRSIKDSLETDLAPNPDQHQGIRGSER